MDAEDGCDCREFGGVGKVNKLDAKKVFQRNVAWGHFVLSLFNVSVCVITPFSCPPEHFNISDKCHVVFHSNTIIIKVV